MTQPMSWTVVAVLSLAVAINLFGARSMLGDVINSWKWKLSVDDGIHASTLNLTEKLSITIAGAATLYSLRRCFGCDPTHSQFSAHTVFGTALFYALDTTLPRLDQHPAGVTYPTNRKRQMVIVEH